MPMARDAQGLSLSTTSAEAVRAFDHAMQGYLKYRADGAQRLTALMQTDGEFSLAHCFKGYMMMLGFKQALLPMARDAHAAALQHAKGATRREQAHVAALGAWIDGDIDRALARWLLPYWERASDWAVPPATLKAAPASEGLLLIDELRPVRCRTLVCDAGKSSFVAASSLAHAPHDWDAPPLPPAALSIIAAVAAPPPAQPELALTASVTGSVSGAKLRRALARRSAPVLQSPSESRGSV